MAIENKVYDPQPLFSCVIPVKGDRSYLAEALESLRSQGIGDNLEVIVQDGDIEADCGQSDALNKGFARAHGEWLFWLNADDILLPGALLMVADMIKKVPCAIWLAAGTKYIDLHGNYIGKKFDKHWHPWLYRHLPVWTFGPSSFFKRELWETCGGFDTSMHYMMDLDLWTRWARLGKKFEVLPDYAWGFRIHSGSKTSGGQYDKERALERKRFYERYKIKHKRFWTNLQRLSRLFDGSYFKK